MDPTETAVVAVRPKPRLVRGNLSREDLGQVASWISANSEALIGYRDGELSTVSWCLA